MTDSDNAKQNDEAHNQAEEGNSQSQQDVATGSSDSKEPLNNTRMLQHDTTAKSSSGDLSDPQKPVENQEVSTSHEDTPSSHSKNKVVFDPENPMDFFLSEESKYASKYVPDPSAEEFRVADVDRLLSVKSIVCWALLTIVLVGGSLAAVVLTVDWDTTAGDDDSMNSTTIEIP